MTTNQTDRDSHQDSAPSSGLQTLTCPHCAWEFYVPAQPVYDLDFVAVLLGLTKRGLVAYLAQHKETYPPRYRWYNQNLKRRVLFAEEVQRLQRHFIRRHWRVARTEPEGAPPEAGMLGTVNDSPKDGL